MNVRQAVCESGLPPLILRDRLYHYTADAGIKEGVVVTVDLATGQWRRTISVALSPLDSPSDAVTGVVGNDVVVGRQRQRLSGIDPDSGRVLWRHTAPGDRIPGVQDENGAVTIYSAVDAGCGHSRDAIRSGGCW